MISKVLESAEWTSANPTHINRLIQINAIDNPDFESEIKEIIKQESEQTIEKSDDKEVKREKQVKDVEEKLGIWDKGNVGDIHNFTAEQFGNVKSLATNPTGFIFQTFMRKFAKGAGVLALAVLIFEAVQWIINELMKPGRMLDRRFRREIENEILAFRSREEKQKLNQGLTNIIVASRAGLRGGEGQTYNSYRTVATGQSQFPKEYRRTQLVTDGRPSSKTRGQERYG